MDKQINIESFMQELVNANLGNGVSVSENGDINFSESVSQDDKNSIIALRDAHDYETANFNKLKADAFQSIITFAANARAQVAGNVDQYKLAGWAAKAEAARRILANIATDGEKAAIQAEADKRGQNETVEQLATKVVAKADQLQAANGIIEGMESSAKTVIEATTTVKQLDAALETLLTEAETELAALMVA